MRCIFAKGKQGELLFFVKGALRISWRDLASRLHAGYTTVRDWRDEKYSISERVFKTLVKMCPNCKHFENYILDRKMDNWGRKQGGLSTKQKGRGFLDPKYAEKAISWRRSGGRTGSRKWHAEMKIYHPMEYYQSQQKKLRQSLKYKHEYQDRKYRNLLELEVARVFAESGVQFEYERMYRCEDKFYFPDFTTNSAIVECTYWDDVEQRAKELRKKPADYTKSGPRRVFIVTFPEYKEKYSRLLRGSNATVITPEILREMLGGKTGRV